MVYPPFTGQNPAKGGSFSEKTLHRYSRAPIVKNIIVVTSTILTKPTTYLSQRSYGICATAKPPITTALVGVNKFTRPEADWKAVMISALLIFVNSPNGTIMGIDKVANPELGE